MWARLRRRERLTPRQDLRALETSPSAPAETFIADDLSPTVLEIDSASIFGSPGSTEPQMLFEHATANEPCEDDSLLHLGQSDSATATSGCPKRRPGSPKTLPGVRRQRRQEAGTDIRW